MIKIRIRFFSIYSDYALDREFETTCRITIGELVDELLRTNPGLRSVFENIKPIILVNGKRVDHDYVLNNNDEVAFIPPVSGG